MGSASMVARKKTKRVGEFAYFFLSHPTLRQQYFFPKMNEIMYSKTLFFSAFFEPEQSQKLPRKKRRIDFVNPEIGQKKKENERRRKKDGLGLETRRPHSSGHKKKIRRMSAKGGGGGEEGGNESGSDDDIAFADDDYDANAQGEEETNVESYDSDENVEEVRF